MNHVIILAAGNSQRFKKNQDKLTIPVAGQPLIYYPIMAFNDHPEVKSITLVVNTQNRKKINELVKRSKFSKVKKIILGGNTRQQSVQKGVLNLKKSAKKNHIVLVHNAANPFPSFKEISQIVKKAKDHPCIVGHFAKSTIKEVNTSRILKTHDRKKIFKAETPQAAKMELFLKGIEYCKKNKIKATDEAMLFEEIGEKVKYLKANPNNFKVTSEADLKKVSQILGEPHQDFLVGIGQDSHLFSDKEKGLILAGVEFSDQKKLEANSDGDVILHAIFNSISQALGDKSLGFYADPMCQKGIKDSQEYLKKILSKMKRRKFKINNLGLMLECKTPRIDNIAYKLKQSLSKKINLPVQRIGITATSGENSTIFGKGLGIQCFAIISLKKK